MEVGFAWRERVDTSVCFVEVGACVCLESCFVCKRASVGAMRRFTAANLRCFLRLAFGILREGGWGCGFRDAGFRVGGGGEVEGRMGTSTGFLFARDQWETCMGFFDRWELAITEAFHTFYTRTVSSNVIGPTH